MVVSKINDMQMKNKHEEIMSSFFHGIQRDVENEFSIKVTGYCLIYAPYYICFLETEDSDFSDFVLREIQNTIGQHSHEQQLEQHRQQQEHQHQRPVVNDFAPVQHHADADKKQAQQDIVKRTNIRFNLVFKFGL